MNECSAENLNVHGSALTICSVDPMTGWARDGTCKLYPGDRGTHTTCAKLTTEFLVYQKSMGNNLMDPTLWGFPGLKEGDQWCLCAGRWNQAFEAYTRGEISRNGVPELSLNATHMKTAQMVTGGMKTIEDFALKKK